MDTTIRDLQKIFDTSRALGYINEEYRKLIKTKEGSLAYYKQRLAEEGKWRQKVGCENEASGKPSKAPRFVGGTAEGGTTWRIGGGTTGGSGGGMGGGGGY